MLLISLRDELADAIYSGTKKCELRKSRPKISRGDRVAIYETRPRAAITGTMTVDDTLRAPVEELWEWVSDAGVPEDRFLRYFATQSSGFAIRIESATRLEEPIPLRDARALDSSFRAPQSFLYIRSSSKLAEAIRLRSH